MVTTIQVSQELKETLAKRKSSSKDSYEDVIWDLLEDTLQFSEQTKRDIAQAREDYKAGRVKTLEQVEKDLGL